MKKFRAGWMAVLLIGGMMPSAMAGPLAFDKSEYAARRAKLMAMIPDGIAVLWGSTAGPQNNEMIYFSGVKVPRAVLVVDGVRKESAIIYTTSETYLKG
ncbi:MAG: hypothetical protein ACYDH0_12850, partial [Candidatus Aminicenantales bacterium]